MSKNKKFYKDPNVSFEDVLEKYSGKTVLAALEKEKLLKWARKHYTDEQQKQLIEVLPTDEEMEEHLNQSITVLNQLESINESVFSKALGESSVGSFANQLGNSFNPIGVDKSLTHTLGMINSAVGENLGFSKSNIAIPEIGKSAMIENLGIDKTLKEILGSSKIMGQTLGSIWAANLTKSMNENFLKHMEFSKLPVPEFPSIILNNPLKELSNTLTSSSLEELKSLDDSTENADITPPDSFNGSSDLPKHNDVDFYLVKPNGEIIGEVRLKK